ncbi:sensor histidine kinase [Paenibacillus sp. CCS19]|uniref:sensor histidine kinase n=1 Tax=Paenibacillus sp. CCS19 TaxID=3158387 RepID=UPI00256DA8C9|nr:sensor histidine kinase [Paenibacillus cellulosilyticus]GMK36985.1 sensor histidine kinase [Paenibacillus cellulosilyticus]
MKIARFLRYERSYLLLYAAMFLLTIGVFWADPGMFIQWQTLLYAFILVALLLAVFLIARYMTVQHAVRNQNDEDTEPLSLEAESYKDAMDEARIAHIHALNEVQARQKEYYDFIVSWFHEIKTPIAVLRLMQQTNVELKVIEDEVSRIEHYVDQALYYAKLDTFNQDYEIMNIDLEQLAKEAVKAHAKTFISRKIKIRLDLPPAIVQSDPKWLSFIVSQLLSNGLKYTEEGGEISISSHMTQDERRLVVRDNGIGIDAKDMPRVFNRGFTGVNGSVHAKSTGMGLYLAQELSRKLGHYITCESVVGQYSAFTIHFPRNHDPYLNTVRSLHTDA